MPIASSACIRAAFSRARPDEEAKWRASRAKAIRQGNIEENDVICGGIRKPHHLGSQPGCGHHVLRASFES
jgi:hypothetical protein